MHVTDEEEYLWFLFQDGDELLLDVNCGHGGVGYSFTMVLSNDERTEYKAKGRTYIQSLANDIHNSAPGLAISKSKYKERHIFNKFEKEMTQAIKVWREKNLNVPR